MHEQTHPRKPLLAALMSFILPGFGQLYNGEVNKAIWLFLAFALLSQPAIVLAALYLPSVMMMPALLLGLLLALALWIFGIVDARRTARRLDAYVAQAWQTSGAYMLILILCDVVALPTLTGYIRGHQVEPFRVPSSSMEPTVLPGDVFFADKRYNCPDCKQGVRRGDVALFVYPNDRSQVYIKRIIGMPGDRVRIRDVEVTVNEVALTARSERSGADLLVTEHDAGRHWQVRWSGSHSGAPDADLTVPPGQVLVLGDNRNRSADSRTIGTVPLQEIVGKACQVWFSAGADGIRWERLGKVLE